MTIDYTLCRGPWEACYELCMYTGTQNVGYGQFVLLLMYHFTTQWNTHFVNSNSWLHVLMLSFVDPCNMCCFSRLHVLSYTSWARPAVFRIPLQCCKMYGGMLKIGLQPSRSSESWLKILGYITGSRVSHRASLLLLLWSWFLFPFLFYTIMSLNSHN
jgi:hypothetical protein